MRESSTASNARGSVGADLLCRKVFTTGQVAKLFHVAPRTVVQWVTKGILNAWTIPLSHDRRISREEIIRFATEYKCPLPEFFASNGVRLLCVGIGEGEVAELKELTTQRFQDSGITLEFSQTRSLFDAGVLMSMETFAAIIGDFSLGRVEAVEMAISIGKRKDRKDLLLYGLTSEDESDLDSLNHGLFNQVWQKPICLSEVAASMCADLRVLLKLVEKSKKSKRLSGQVLASYRNVDPVH